MSFYCHNCGEELSPTASFCLKCGALKSSIEQSMQATPSDSASTDDEKAFVERTQKNLTIERTLSIIFGIVLTCLGGLTIILAFLLMAIANNPADEIMGHAYLAEAIMLFAIGIVNIVNVFSVSMVRVSLYSDLSRAKKRYESKARLVFMFLFCTNAFVLHIINKCRFDACHTMVSDIIVKQKDGKFGE